MSGKFCFYERKKQDSPLQLPPQQKNRCKLKKMQSSASDARASSSICTSGVNTKSGKCLKLVGAHIHPCRLSVTNNQPGKCSYFRMSAPLKKHLPSPRHQTTGGENGEFNKMSEKTKRCTCNMGFLCKEDREREKLH